MLSLGCLFFTLIGVSLQNGPEHLNQLVSSISGEFSLAVSQAGIEGKTVAGVVNSPIIFTLALNHWQGDQLQLGWISNGVYVVPKDELGQKVVFRRGQTNQTIHLEANLIGVYSIRFSFTVPLLAGMLFKYKWAKQATLHGNGTGHRGRRIEYEETHWTSYRGLLPVHGYAFAGLPPRVASS